MNVKKIKRIYEIPHEKDGFRILVDRLWPRGVSKEKANLDEWAKNIAPSTAIRKEFNHNPNLLDEFKSKYLFELDHNEHKQDFVNYIKNKLNESPVTLLFAAKNEKVNHALILKEWLEEELRYQD
jgi:uncharacterized protein YeaO (DUF488 family)